MTLNIRSTDTIYEQFREELMNRSDTLTNFTDGSFNDIYVSAHSEQIRQAELRTIAAELGGTIEYAGKDLTNEDLRRLGLDDVEPAEINQYMYDRQLDYLADNYGAERSPGTRATGVVEIEVADDTVEIEEGMVVSTAVRGEDTQFDFLVDVDGDGEIETERPPTVSPDDGETTVTVNVIAESPGSEYNVGPRTISRVPVPEPGILSVSNPDAVTGGEDPQSNESLREDLRTAIFDSAQGGTKLGIESYVQENTTTPVDINIDEFTDEQPPYVDVVVEGATLADIQQLVEESRPPGIRHNVVRPNKIGVGVYTNVVGDNIDTDFLETTVNDSLSGFDLSDTFSQSALLNDIITSQADIISVPALNTYVTEIENETHEFQDGTETYELRQAPLGRVTDETHRASPDRTSYQLYFDNVVESSVTASAVIDDERTTIDDTEYSLSDSTDSGGVDTLVLDDSVSPDPGTTLDVSYTHSEYEITEVRDTGGTVYEQGSDYGTSDTDGNGLIDSIEWLTDGSHPDDGDHFSVTYQASRSFEGDRFADERELFVPGRIEYTVINE